MSTHTFWSATSEAAQGCRLSFPGSPYFMSSEDTLTRARRLDTSALSKIHDQYYPEVYRYVRFRVEDEQVCEDITAEVFLRLLDALHKQRGPLQNLRGWLLGTASNVINDHLRKRYARKEESLKDEHPMPDKQHPEHYFEETWQLAQVRAAIRKLTPEQQHVLALRFADECSLDETARIMGKSVTAIKALQFRAVASLRRFLEGEE